MHFKKNAVINCSSVNVLLQRSLTLSLQYSNKNGTIMLFENRGPHKFIKIIVESFAVIVQADDQN